ncbi:MAG: ribosome biogenesis GTPase YlqF [Erysipelotrichales bacterium]|nr:ribosome biogenesis GTPase YlqF [Erysipelotrichales bacterium]
MSENKTAINWFPGHMAKANRQMKEQLKSVDLLIEVRDARIPFSSANPDLEKLAPQKPRIILLNKSDKADPVLTERWINKLSDDIDIVISVNALNEQIKTPVYKAALQLTSLRRERQMRKGMKPTPIKAMVVGIPNAGKSTVINSIAKKKIAVTADHPGVTKKVTWIKAADDFYLLDTPGVLWPKIEDPDVGLRLAVTGAIRDEILPLDDMIRFALEYLLEHKENEFLSRYGIERPEGWEDAVKKIGIAKGMIQKGAEVDELRVKKMLIKEIRSDKIGRITWEIPQ